MADPLSLAASVTGLISLSAHITSVLYSFATSALEARKSVDRVLSEMQTMNSIFSQVQGFIYSASEESSDTERLLMISLDHLVTTLTGCVLIFSELEKHINELVGLTGLANVAGMAIVWEKVKWATKEPEIGMLVEDLQRHKSSLNLMLGIIQCHSSSEAKKNSRKLHSVMQEILESNHALSTQLRTVMSRQNTMNSVIQDDNNTKPIMNKRSTSTLQQSAEFEAILRKSRPYKHKSHQNNESVVPSRSCPPNPSNWTVRSELSLGELSTSDISDFKLPIYPFDITNPESYQQCNFAGNTYVPDPPPRDDRRGDVVIETTTPRDEMRTSVSEPKSAMQGTVYNLRQIRKQVFPWKLVRIADTDAGVFREDTFRENIFREDIFREDRGTTRDIPKIFCEDLDPGTALPTPPKPEPEHKLKTVAIRGTAAILRRLSVTKKPTEVDETETNHNKSVSDLHTPFSAGDTEEWDGSLRRVMWDGARSSPEESRRNSWSGQIPSHSTSNVWDERWMAVPGGQPTGRRHSSAVDETPTTNSPESTARGETSSLFPPNSSERQFSTYTAILAHAPVDGE